MPGHFTFFAEKIEGRIAFFSEQEAKHALLVLRYSVGDEIEFSAGDGHYYSGIITEATKRGMLAQIDHTEQIKPSQFTLAVGILKSSDRMEWLVEKCTEIGVGKLVFFKSQNSERAKINLDKLRKTAISAMKQSHGAWLPIIEETTFEKALEIPAKQKFLAYCDQSMVSKKPFNFDAETIVFIGPEGDFSKNEVELSKSKNVQTIGLGDKILRTETAALVCASWSIA